MLGQNQDFLTHWEGRVGQGVREMLAEGWAVVMNAGLGYFIYSVCNFILFHFCLVCFLCVSFIDFLHL